MAASRMEAAERSFFLFFQTSTTGPKAAVYLAPFPELWSAMREARLLVIPVYKEPFAQRTIYTVQVFFGETAGIYIVGAGGKGMGSERPHGGRRLHKRGGRVRRRAHGVRDAVSDGPIPLPTANLQACCYLLKLAPGHGFEP